MAERQPADPSIMPEGLGEVHPLRALPGQIGGVLVRLVSPIGEAPLRHSNHYVREHFVDEVADGGTQPEPAA